MPGVTPLDESAKLLRAPDPAETLPAPGSSGVTAALPPVAGYRPDDDGYGSGLPIVTEVVGSLPVLPTGAGYAALTELAAENGVAARVAGAVEFIEVGPISVVLNGVSALLPTARDWRCCAWDFRDLEDAPGPPYRCAQVGRGRNRDREARFVDLPEFARPAYRGVPCGRAN